MQSIHALKQLYELDDSQWLGETISLLRNHQFQQLDLEHLIEELEDLGKENIIQLIGRKKFITSVLN